MNQLLSRLCLVLAIFALLQIVSATNVSDSDENIQPSIPNRPILCLRNLFGDPSQTSMRYTENIDITPKFSFLTKEIQFFLEKIIL